MISTSKQKVTGLIVGAGAVENAWGPVVRAIQNLFDFPITADGANSYLARLVYLLRWWSSDHTDFGKNELKKHKEFLQTVKKSIAEELRRAQLDGEIRPREQFGTIVDFFLFRNSRKFIFVTTNWDTVIDAAFFKELNRIGVGISQPLHIHGSVDDIDLMYLPTEVTKEPYRTPDEEIRIGSLHGSIWRALEYCHRIVIYGLSLSPLDAELGQILACGFASKTVKEICIVAPDHESIAHRVNLLLDPRYPVAVKGYAPDRLGKEYKYTLTARFK